MVKLTAKMSDMNLIGYWIFWHRVQTKGGEEEEVVWKKKSLSVYNPLDKV